MNASNPALKQLFAELTDYSWADGLQESQRDPAHASYQGTMFEAMEDDVRDSLRNGGGKYEPSEYGLKTTPPTDISLRRDFENLALTLSEAMLERIVNGRSDTFSELFSRAKGLSEADTVVVEKPYLLSEAWKDFRQYKSSWSHKMATQNTRYYRIE